MRILGLLALCFATVTFSTAQDVRSPRERIRFDDGWRFALGHATDRARDFNFETGYFSDEAKAGFGDGPADPKFDDRAWRRLDLPHDWAVELPFSEEASVSHGFKAIGRNFPQNSIGWYRRTFPIAQSDLGRRISLEFDGIYRDAVVWVNGFRLGRHASGYTGQSYDITDYLNYGEDNVVVVRADATKEEGWFYEGAGIYRHVWLTKTAPLHLVRRGTAIATDLQPNAAEVRVRSSLVNESAQEVRFEVEQQVRDAAGAVVAAATASTAALAAGRTAESAVALSVPSPRLWSVETPTLYRLVTTVRANGAVVDRDEVPFGIRTVRFDPNHGFFLNGRRVELLGVNLHQDFAGVGVAVPDGVQDYRLQQLRWMGVNAIRCAHNPPTPEFLDACDRLGFLVVDENRVMGINPAQLQELRSMIERDRNHPSVILWSLGNEEWALEGNIKGARVASTMQNFARALDPTRTNTVANSGGWGGISSVIDVVGYNYINQSNPEEQHAKFPQQSGVGTEETTTQGTRGVYVDDRAHVHLGPQVRGDTGGNTEKGWKYYEARPFLAGVFFWTGFD
jgi:beta-galactosidase